MKRIRALAAVLVVCGSCATIEHAPPVEPTLNREMWRNSVRLGTCRGAQDIDLSSIKAFEEEQMEVSGPGFNVTLQIVGEEIIQRWAEPHARTTLHSIEDFVLGASGDVDVVGRFVEVGGQIMIFWRETYLHRSYRLGLIGVSAHGLYSVCQGGAGADASP